MLHSRISNQACLWRAYAFRLEVVGDKSKQVSWGKMVEDLVCSAKKTK